MSAAVAEMYEPRQNADPVFFMVMLAERDDIERARRILNAAILQINDRVTDLYAGQAMPARTSELERENYV